ncbi:Histone-lysine N-methyltransferase SETD2 [Fukomys damarensis]|uniref:Histone-lysine N-methyltransferase SETD2 n=1 Tax=Fukomys damarensis TaxID=885580 RepID=A0A091DQB5_FUKDA|nr:Histone-lysine N-methyltransferase SETD2 [Fukomys damarensis]
MNVHLESKTVVCDKRNLTDQHSKFTCEENKQSVESSTRNKNGQFDTIAMWSFQKKGIPYCLIEEEDQITL